MIYKKKNNFGKYFGIFIVLILLGGGGYLFVSPQFEKKAPIISMEDKGFWNLKKHLKVNISDDSGIKYLRISFSDGAKEIVLKEEVYKSAQKALNIDIEPPKLDMFFKGKKAQIKVEAIDASKWNFFEGNKALSNFELQIDTKKPSAEVILNSLAIRRGGSAIAVVHVKDENLQSAYISFNDEVEFKLIPFYKENYFISLIAWPVDIEKFERVSLIAIDKAGNKTKAKVPLFIRKLKIKDDNIKVSDSFIKNASMSVLEKSGSEAPVKDIDVFIQVNRDIRAKNVKKLRDIMLKNMDISQVDDFTLKPFARLRGSKTVAGFAERRHYYYNNEKIDEAWHLGMDWASVKKAPIRATNGGKVIFNEYLGIYGNSVIIDHRLGLATLYSHTSSSNVEVGDEVIPRQKIANTGATGAVFGDHLHFGVLVQGIEVNPIEWMDGNWIKTRITDIIKESKQIINSKN